MSENPFPNKEEFIIELASLVDKYTKEVEEGVPEMVGTIHPPVTAIIQTLGSEIYSLTKHVLDLSNAVQQLQENQGELMEMLIEKEKLTNKSDTLH